MGYRSDVRIITSKRGFKELKKYVDDYLKKQSTDSYNLLEHCDIKEDTKYSSYFGWNWVKWYEESYEDVIAIMNGLKHLEEKDFSYRYARIGESYDDYDEQYYESESEEEQDLEYTSFIREFDDSYVIDNLQKSCEPVKSGDVEI